MPATPRRSDAVFNRQKILDAAERMFSRHGLATSIEDVAREAQTGVGTVYRNFPTKAALVAEIASITGAGLLREADRLVAQAYRTQALRQFLHAMIRVTARKRDLLEAMGGAGWTRAAELAPIRERTIATVATLLARAQHAGDVRDDLSTHDFLTLLRGLFLSEASEATRLRLLDVVLEGLAPRARRAARRRTRTG